MEIAFVYMNDMEVIGRGAGYIAGAIKAAGYPLSFYDTFYTESSVVAQDIIDRESDILMISTMTMNFPKALVLIREVKKRNNNITVLLGGIHPTIMGERLLELHSEIDYLCIGEGESMIVEFLHNFSTDALFDVQNLCYRKNGKIFSNPIRPPEDLATLPAFPWHFSRRESKSTSGNSHFWVTASRGCPYNCTYCCNGIYLKLYGKNYIRFRPIEQIIEELKYLKERYSPSLFYFGDEMILSDPKYTEALFAKLKEEIAVPYGLMARVEHITSELVEHLKETGCQYVAMGVECGDEQFRRKHLNRVHSNEQIEKAFTLLKKANIFRSSFNIIGYPFDNDDELIEKTVQLNKQLKPDYAYFTIFYPFPGTRLYDRCIEMDLINKERIEKNTLYYEESVLKNVNLKMKRDRIARQFNSIFSFDFLFELVTSGKGDIYCLLLKTKYFCNYHIRQLLKQLLGKKITVWIRKQHWYQTGIFSKLFRTQ